MSHSHNHHNHHNDHHNHSASSLSSAFFFAIGINIAFVFVEIFFGLKIHSLALLSDAGHNMVDILNLILSGVALWISRKKSTPTFTYGFRRVSIYSALINSILLIVTAIFLILEALDRLLQPVETIGSTMMIVASIGIFVNGFSGWILMRVSNNDVNIKSAYFHLMGDALVSLGVVIGGAVIYFTNFLIIDSIISITVSLIMMYGVKNILSESLRMTFDGVPLGINISQIEEKILAVTGVENVHHIHVWSLSTQEIAFTGHVLLEAGVDIGEKRDAIVQVLKHFGVRHVTIEMEYTLCNNVNCDNEC